MKPAHSRRTFLKRSLAAAASVPFFAGTTAARDYAELPEEAKGLTAYQIGKQIWIRWQNEPVTTYRAHPTQKYPYFYPLNGPVSGRSLTTDSGLPYPHHRSLWLGCEPVNGGDYWGGGRFEKGQIVSEQLELGEVTSSSAVFTDHCRWVRREHPSPLQDRRHFTVAIHDPRVHLLDCRFTITALADLTIKQAKHSFFAIRAAYDVAPIGGGTLENSEGGKNAKGAYGKPARWCSYYGKRRGSPDVVEGIAIMDHPDNFGGSCPWFVRDYGNLSPSPFNFLKEPWTLRQGESIDLKYRVVLHAGDPQEAQLDHLYDQWLATLAESATKAG